VIKPDYLGDAVYVTDEGHGRVMLTTDHHEKCNATNIIILEPEVLDALDRYRQRMNEGVKP
jgi:hypothetical protein